MRSRFGTVKWTPTDKKITANCVHTDLSGMLDFGVPYFHTASLNGHATEYGVPREAYYGFVNRDFQNAIQFRTSKPLRATALGV